MTQLHPTYLKALLRMDHCQMALDKAKTHRESYRAEGAMRSAQRNAMRAWLLVTPEGRATRLRRLDTPSLLEMDACGAVARDLNQMRAGVK